jgi:phage terminase large subunit-like protein
VSLRGCSPRSPAAARFATPPGGRPNFAAPVAAVAAALGFDLMPWQRQVNATGTEMGPAGLPVYRQVTVEVMRQQGKSIDVLSLMLARALDTPGAMWAYSAQTRLAGRRRMLDVWWPLIRRSPLSALAGVRKGYGSEAFVFRNGSMIMLASGTEVSDHGDSLDGAVIDEAWAHRDDTIEQAFKPAMLTRPHAQLWIPSAAGTIHSHYFKGKVDDGRARAELGLTDAAAYFGWSAPDDADPADPETWWGCMPALGITVTEETVRADFETMKLAEFRRAYLCQWPDVADAGWATIGKDVWMAARL